MTRVDEERLRRLLGDPQLAWLVRRVRRRIQLSKPLEGSITLAEPPPSDRPSTACSVDRRARAGA